MKIHRLFCAVVLCVLVCPLVVGQTPYKDMKPARGKVSEIITKGPTTPEDKKLLEEYFLNYQLARWENSDNFVNLPEYRGDLDKHFAASSGKGAGYDAALKIVFTRLVSYVRNEKSPKILRLNALLMIGELSKTPKMQGRAHEPIPESKKLFEAYLSGETYLKIAALKGLVRYSSGAIAPAEAKDLHATFSKFAFVPPADEGEEESAEVIWCRLLALEGLGNLRLASDGCPGKLLAIIQGEAYNMDSRIAAALAFSRLDLTAQSLGKTKPMEAWQALAKLATEALVLEYKRVYVLERGMEGAVGSSMGGMSGPIQMSEEENALQIRSLKRRVKAVASIFYPALRRDETSKLQALITTSADVKFVEEFSKKIRVIQDMYDNVGVERVKKERGEESGTSVREMGYSTVSAEPNFLREKERLRRELLELCKDLGRPTKDLPRPTSQKPTGPR